MMSFEICGCKINLSDHRAIWSSGYRVIGSLIHLNQARHQPLGR